MKTTLQYLKSLFLLLSVQQLMAQEPILEIDASNYQAEIAPTMYGVFFEDINYAADGGLYAELVQNRSFEYHSLERTHRGTGFHPLYAWEKVARQGGDAEIRVVNTKPLNQNNRNYLQLKILQGGIVG